MTPEDRARTIAYLDLEERRGPVDTLDDERVRELLTTAHRIAVIGASDDSSRPSHDVFRHMLASGFDAVPVTPNHPAVADIPAFATLAEAVEATGPFDIVDVFRRPESCAAHAREAVAVGARCLWLQLGIVDWEAARIAHDGGLAIVMDRCLSVEWHRLGQSDVTPEGA